MTSFGKHLKKKNYFEGWYFKQVSADGKWSLSFIPGISLTKEDRHAFIQYILVEADNTHPEQKVTHTGYIRYPLNEFTYLNKPFAVQIGSSIFTEQFIEIDLADNRFHFKGRFLLGEFQPINTSFLQPNIMGIFGYLPKMECYHGVISMKHSLKGEIFINKNGIDFTKGRGYIEKDWGTSFPKQYIWLHCNHFTNPSISLFFSIAHIPFYLFEFEGFICNLVVDNQEYRFATYNGSRCEITEILDSSVRIILENKGSRLELQAHIFDQGQLLAPIQGKMTKTIKEGIDGEIQIQLQNKATGEIQRDVGRNAGIEIVDY